MISRLVIVAHSSAPRINNIIIRRVRQNGVFLYRADGIISYYSGIGQILIILSLCINFFLFIYFILFDRPILFHFIFAKQAIEARCCKTNFVIVRLELSISQSINIIIVL